jgi:hypothetical protein
MNELIHELAEHCDFYVGNEHSDKSHEEKQRLFMEKFAQLIVLECIKIIDAEEPGYQDYRSQIEVMMRNDCAKALEYKFGLPINERF